MNQRYRLLAVDDDPAWLEQVPIILEDDCEVDAFPTLDQGVQAISSQFYDILLLDLNFHQDSRTGLEFFKQVHALNRDTEVVMVTAEPDRKKLIELFNAGVKKFVPKPATPDEVRKAVRDIIREKELKLKAINLATVSQGPTKGPILIGDSQVMQKLRTEIARVIKNGSRDILLLGETGTGKDVVARMIAQKSDRSGRFIAIHCGAINGSLIESELFGHVKGSFTGAIQDKVGAFEAAQGGFVFLDEIGEMPLSQQPKLLRVLQERKVVRVGSIQEREASFRTISATHVDLEQAVEEKNFRRDLYYRIAREIIHIPSLRERVEDIPELVYHFLNYSPSHRSKQVTPEALTLLQNYTWPGNVRQLSAVVETMASRCESDTIREKDVCQAIPEIAAMSVSQNAKYVGGRYGALLIASEKKRFEKAIIEARGDRTRAAEILGLSRATFFRKAKDLGLVRNRSHWP